LSFGYSVVAHPEPSVTTSFRSGGFRLLFVALLLRALTAHSSTLVSRFFRSRTLVTLGKYSYGLYVYHHFLSYFFTKHGTEFALTRVLGSHSLAVGLQAIAGMVVSMAVAWLSYECFEKHFLGLKRFWPSSNERSATGP
jgi:peptidoglycan/LPS O-acetylase OafA/YrhL